ncbi:hypothetical protein MHBO_002898 [Bonamia ostreae]|uniref:Serine-threonine/tyrosine-protein kinase catalytic domain-containing protein n=1 Tax=Bonamia ostreae TaxID=126728 RepID=A0ABV2ANW2_9EUKA
MIKGGYRISKPLDGPIECPEYFYNIMVDCWETNPENRPTFKALHKMLKDYSIHDTEESDEDDIYGMWDNDNVKICDEFDHNPGI